MLISLILDNTLQEGQDRNKIKTLDMSAVSHSHSNSHYISS